MSRGISVPFYAAPIPHSFLLSGHVPILQPFPPWKKPRNASLVFLDFTNICFNLTLINWNYFFIPKIPVLEQHLQPLSCFQLSSTPQKNTLEKVTPNNVSASQTIQLGKAWPTWQECGEPALFSVFIYLFIYLNFLFLFNDLRDSKREALERKEFRKVIKRPPEGLEAPYPHFSPVIQIPSIDLPK